jgi:hypothetical protein
MLWAPLNMLITISHVLGCVCMCMCACACVCVCVCTWTHLVTLVPSLWSLKHRDCVGSMPEPTRRLFQRFTYEYTQRPRVFISRHQCWLNTYLPYTNSLPGTCTHGSCPQRLRKPVGKVRAKVNYESSLSERILERKISQNKSLEAKVCIKCPGLVSWLEQLQSWPCKDA